MKAIIVGRDSELMELLSNRLTKAGLTVEISENANAVMGILQKSGIQFVVADASVFIGQKLARDLLKGSPLIRLIGFSAQPNLPGMVEALTEGLIDYFPRTPEYCDAVVATVLSERRRLTRWQSVLLTDSLAAGDQPATAAPSS